MPFFTYWLWPNPPAPAYSSPKVMALLVLFALFIVAFVALGQWRKRIQNPATKTLSAGWPTAALWFGIVGLVLTVARVEQIQFLSMRVLWIVWMLILLVYCAFQIFHFRSRHYVIVRKERTVDLRDRYMPKKRR